MANRIMLNASQIRTIERYKEKLYYEINSLSKAPYSAIKEGSRDHVVKKFKGFENLKKQLALHGMDCNDSGDHIMIFRKPSMSKEAEDNVYCRVPDYSSLRIEDIFY